jgi:hypothetical protein
MCAETAEQDRPTKTVVQAVAFAGRLIGRSIGEPKMIVQYGDEDVE